MKPLEIIGTATFLIAWFVLALAFSTLGGCANLQPQVNTALSNLSSVTLDTKQAVHDAMLKQIQQDYQFVQDYNALVIQHNANAPVIVQAPATTPAQAPVAAAVAK